MVLLIMDNADHTPRVEAFMAGIAGRIGVSTRWHSGNAPPLPSWPMTCSIRQPPIAQPEPRLITVLIIDLRGFSVLADTCDPPLLLAVLKPFFERMTTLVHEHGGFVDKFLGDGVMALFGAPQRQEDHLQKALACAARMQQAMLDLNAGNIARGTAGNTRRHRHQHRGGHGRQLRPAVSTASTPPLVMR